MTVARYQAANSAMYRSDYHGALALNFVVDSSGEHAIQVGSWRHQNKRYWHDTFY
jgi:competence protein ComEC